MQSAQHWHATRPLPPPSPPLLPHPQDSAWHLLTCATMAPLHAAAAAAAAPRGAGGGGAAALQQQQQQQRLRAAPFGLGDAAAAILRGGEAAYDPHGRRAYRYAELLLAVGQPELAVAHLAVAGHAELPERHLHDAAHLALALDHYGLLRTLPAAQLEAEATAAAAAGGGGSGLPAGVSRVPGTGGLIVALSSTTYPLAAAGASEGGGGIPCVAIDLARLLSVYAGRVLHWAPGEGRVGQRCGSTRTFLDCCFSPPRVQAPPRTTWPAWRTGPRAWPRSPRSSPRRGPTRWVGGGKLAGCFTPCTPAAPAYYPRAGAGWSH